MKVVLSYRDNMREGMVVFNTLARSNVEILETKRSSSDSPQVTIDVSDDETLKQLVGKLNRSCRYDVSVVKVDS